MYKSEQILVILYQYRDLLPNIKAEQEKTERFRFLDESLNMLHQALGKHEEVAYAVKSAADLLKFNDKQQEAMGYYSAAFEMYNLFGPELEIQQVNLLKAWSDCLPFEEANEKLQLAKQILEQNCLKSHAWYSQIEKRIKKLRKEHCAAPFYYSNLLLNKY